MFHKNEHINSIVNFEGSCINAIDHYVNYDTFRLNFPAHQHIISFPLFGSSLMFFNKGIQLTVYRACISFIRFISRFMKVFVTIKWCLFFFNKFIYLFIYFWLCWVFVSVRGLSLVVASGGHSSSWCAGLSLSQPLLLWSTVSRHAGSVVVAHGPSCSAACGIFPDQGSNPCPLHWQADPQPLRHQGSPNGVFLKWNFLIGCC